MDAIDKINLRLKKLLEYVAELKKYQGITAQELINNSDKRAIVERNLHLACEVVLDIATILNAEYRFRPPDSHKDAIIILGDEGVLSKEFAAEISGIAGFRNLLVRDYIKIDYEKVADKINNRLGDFATFASAVAKYLS